LPDFRDENPVPDTAITLDLTTDWLGQCPLAPLATIAFIHQLDTGRRDASSDGDRLRFRTVPVPVFVEK